MLAILGEIRNMDKKDLIKSLNQTEAEEVLSTLYNENPELEDKIYDIALKVVSQVDEDRVMNDVFYDLDMIDVDDLFSKSGRTSYGYVEPHDLSWEMFDDELQPFINEMKVYQERSLPIEAKIYCCGIIRGLQKYDKDSNSDFKDWAGDAPIESIHIVLEEFKKGNPSAEDIAQVSKLI